MRKAVAIPYIIALILGVIVVAILAYWFISTGGKGGGVGKEAECRGRILDWCTTHIGTALTAASDVCKGTGFEDPKKWETDFCCKLIPNYKPQSGTVC